MGIEMGRGFDLDEADGYAFLEELRWGDSGPPSCPHCESRKGAWFLKPRDPGGRRSKGGTAARSERRVWKCKESSCRRQFSVLTLTALHGTRIPVSVWIGVLAEVCENPAGVSVREIATRWDVTDRAARNMMTLLEQVLNEDQVRFVEVVVPTRATIGATSERRSSAEPVGGLARACSTDVATMTTVDERIDRLRRQMARTEASIAATLRNVERLAAATAVGANRSGDVTSAAKTRSSAKTSSSAETEGVW